MITFKIKDKHQIVVPARFTRAITGFSEKDSPEVDDRGFSMGARPGTWGSSDTRGPMVGLMLNSPAKIRLIREDIDDTAPLFIKSSAPSIVAVRSPAGGGPLGPDGVFTVEGLQDLANSPVSLQICLGSATGPILGEIEPHIFSKFRIPITPHIVRIDSATATGTVPVQPIPRIIERMRSIWWPCGIEIQYDSTTQTPANDIITLSHQDLVNDPGADNWGELKQILGLRRKALGLPVGASDRTINWYIINDFSPNASGLTTVGIGIRRELADQLHTDPGIITTAAGVDNDAEIERVARTVAHEIGHFFTLKHVQEQNADNPVNDTFGRRQLMFPISQIPNAVAPVTLSNVPRIDDIGYGNHVRGCLITLKDHPQHKTDGECAAARRSISANTWF